MAHQYREIIHVEHAGGKRVTFTWREREYAGDIIAMWHLRDRWWEQERESDRKYLRILTDDHQVFELYRDGVPGIWVLDRCLD